MMSRWTSNLASVAGANPVSHNNRSRTMSLRLSTLFSIVVGLIVFVSVGTVLALLVTTSRVSLLERLASEYDFTIATLERRIETHLGGAVSQLDYIASWIARDPTLIDENVRLARVLRAALASTPQTSAIAFLREDRTSVRIERDDAIDHVNDLRWRTDVVQVLGRALAQGSARPDLGWTDPLFSPNIGHTIVVYRRAVWHDGKLKGVLFSAVDLFALSRFAAQLSGDLGQTVFILQGHEKVIAHPNLTHVEFVATPARPMLSISAIGDDRLANLWRDDRSPVISQTRMRRSRGHYAYENGEWQVYVYSELTGFGAEPWLVGFHFDTSTRGFEVRAFWRIVAVGVGLLVLFLLAGMLLGRRLAAPISDIAETAQRVRDLQFDHLPEPSFQRIVEIDQAAQSLQTMVASLRQFQRYVPRRLVEQIVREGRDEIPAEERVITAMFVDIIAFSTLAERMDPRQSTSFLNDHFRRIAEAVEAEDGTIDKYIGDGLLAFWGAPARQEDQADRAIRAARDIVVRMSKLNKRRRSQGNKPIGLRIGIHTGPAIVGNIGAPTRLNYTVVGDTINVASRVEQAARDYLDGDVTVLVTESTLNAAEPGVAAKSLGPVSLRGRLDPVILYRIMKPASLPKV